MIVKDIPVFDTENGVASLILREIPYTSVAYVRVRSSLAPEKLLEECVQFCRACGAERVYGAGENSFEGFHLHTAIWQMRILKENLGDTDAALWPVQQQTLHQWRSLYNERMKDVPNAAYMTISDGEKLLKEGHGYFIHRDGKLLGIGIAGGGKIDGVVAAEPGAGADVVRALAHAIVDETVILEVASENHRAVRLYERLGFIRTGELSKWYQIF